MKLRVLVLEAFDSVTTDYSVMMTSSIPTGFQIYLLLYFRLFPHRLS